MNTYEKDILRGFDNWEECARYYREAWEEAHEYIKRQEDIIGMKNNAIEQHVKIGARLCKLDEIMRKIVIGLPKFSIDAFVAGLTPDEKMIIQEYYNLRFMIHLPKVKTENDSPL